MTDPTSLGVELVLREFENTEQTERLEFSTLYFTLQVHLLQHLTTFTIRNINSYVYTPLLYHFLSHDRPPDNIHHLQHQLLRLHTITLSFLITRSTT